MEGARTDEEREWAREGLRQAEDDCLSELRTRVLGLSQQMVEDRAPRGTIGPDILQLPPGRAEALATAADTVAALNPPTTFAAHFIQGNAFYAAGEFEKALAAYNHALALRPDHPDALNNRAVTLDDLKRYEEALVDCNRALEFRPDDPMILNNRGNALIHLKRYEEALADCDRSLELRPDHPHTLNNRANALFRLGRHKEALADYNRALELRPDHPAILYNRGVTLAGLGRYEEALADYNRSLELTPDDPDTLYNRACLLSLMQKWGESLADLRAAVAIDPDNQRLAREDEHFEGLRNDPEWGPRFWEIVGREDKP